MPCAPQRFLANNRNEVRSATSFAPSSVRPIANAVQKIAGARLGRARVDVTGNYTGANDATFDVKVIDTLVSTRLATQPFLSGAGSGTLVVASGNTVNAQSFTVELWDAGTPTTYAGIDFEGVRIRARAIGAAGNAISLAINASTLVYAASSYSLLADIKLGEGDDSSGWKGVAFDWDTKVVGTNDVIPPTAHRVAFGDDPTVYLNYKRWTGSEWTYHVVPALKRDIGKGTPIKFVTGGRTVTVDDGVPLDLETYPGVVTVFDLLSVLKAQSTLVTVDGVVADDRTPTGQSARELSTRTDAHVDTSVGTGSAAATGFVDAFAGPNAVTELVTAKCFAVNQNDYPLASLGNEYWQLAGSLSGDLGFLKTGVPYVRPSNRFGLTIPVKLPPGFGGNKGRTNVQVIYQNRDVDLEPPICIKRLTLGPAAVDQTITFTWTKRPSGDCACDKEKAPALSAFCVGSITLGADDLAAFKPDTQERIRRLFAWKTLRVESLTDLAEGTEAGLLKDDDRNLASLNSIVEAMLDTLLALDPLDASVVVNPSAITVGATTVLAAVFAEAPAVDAPILLENFAGADAATINDMLVAITAGTTTSVSFKDPSTAGKTITTNSGAARIVVNPARYAGLEEWDSVFADLQSDVASLQGGGTQEAEFQITALEDLAEGQPCIIVDDGDVRKAAVFRQLQAGGLIGWPITAIASGAQGVVRVRGIVTGQSTLTPGVLYYVDITGAGGWTTTPATGVPSGFALTATIIEAETNTVLGRPSPIPTDLYSSKLQNVFAAAGLDPLGKANASILQSGDGCWRDWGGDHWWIASGSIGGEYGPAFNNEPFYTTRKAEKDGAYYRTKELGCVISIKCPDLLVDGDQIVIGIDGAAWGSTYQVGDELVLPVLGAHGIELAGGVNGSAVLHWYVNGSVGGAFADYVYDPGTPTAYSNGGLAFQIYPGGVPWAKGDKFDFDVIGGHYAVQKDGGGYGATTAIPAGTVALSDGLSVAFTPGVAPAFVTNDVYSFRALQPYAVVNLQSPTPDRWEWDPASGSTPSVVIDLGSAKTIAAAAIALHTIPTGATITLEGGTVSGVYTWSEALTWQAGVIFDEFVASHSARYLRLSLTGAPSGGIGWLWAGQALTQGLQSRQSLRRTWKIQRGDAGTFQGGRTLGKSVSGSVQWTEAALNESDVADLNAFLAWSKDNDDEPFVFVPQVTRPAEAYLERVVSDDVEFVDDLSDYGADASVPRRYSITLPLAGVLQ